MEVKRVRVTNRRQFEHLVDRMEANPSVAKGLKFCEGSGLTADAFARLWEELAVGLNSLGPPTRSVKDWQKVWTDFKLKVKNKLAHNKREVNATGGGPNSLKVLSPTEETVVKLLSLDKMVNHSGPAFGLPRSATKSLKSPRDSHQHPSSSEPPQLPEASEREFETAGEDRTDDEDDLEIEITNEQCASSSRGIKRKRQNREAGKDLREELLAKQTEYLKEIVEHTGEIARYSRKMHKQREEELKCRREYWLQKEKDRKSALELKIELLKYKKRKLELLECGTRKK
nr:protein PRRC2C-like [Aedes albopictus]